MEFNDFVLRLDMIVRTNIQSNNADDINYRIAELENLKRNYPLWIRCANLVNLVQDELVRAKKFYLMKEGVWTQKK